MRKKMLTAVLSIAMLCTALSACGGSTAKEGTKAPEQNSSEAKGSEEKAEANAELEGDITFWHSFTQGRDWKPFRKLRISSCRNIRRLILKSKPFPGMTFTPSGPQDLLPGMCPT